MHLIKKKMLTQSVPMHTYMLFRISYRLFFRKHTKKETALKKLWKLILVSKSTKLYEDNYSKLDAWYI